MWQIPPGRSQGSCNIFLWIKSCNIFVVATSSSGIILSGSVGEYSSYNTEYSPYYTTKPFTPILPVRTIFRPIPVSPSSSFWNSSPAPIISATTTQSGIPNQSGVRRMKDQRQDCKCHSNWPTDSTIPTKRHQLEDSKLLPPQLKSPREENPPL